MLGVFRQMEKSEALRTTAPVLYDAPAVATSGGVQSIKGVRYAKRGGPISRPPSSSSRRSPPLGDGRRAKDSAGVAPIVMRDEHLHRNYMLCSTANSFIIPGPIGPLWLTCRSSTGNLLVRFVSLFVV